MAEYAAFTDAPAYTESSVIAESSRVVNFRREALLGGTGKNKYALLRQPGMTKFVDTLQDPGKFVRGMIVTQGGSSPPTFHSSQNYRLFAVIRDAFWEITGKNHFGIFGGSTMVNDNLRAYMASSPTQVAIVSGGNLYVFTLATNAFQQVTTNLIGTPNCVAYLDGFFILTFLNSTQYQISAANDATTWDATQVTAVSSRPDFLLSVRELKERLWFFGTSIIESVYNAGNAPFPFLSDISAVFNIGLLAPASVERLEDQIFFLGTNTSGGPAGYKISGHDIKPTSNPSIEAIWATYQNQSLAYGWCLKENGHPCWRISFPNTDGQGNSTTWEYDDSLGPVMGWTETPYWDGAKFEAHLGFCSVNAFNAVLVGSRLDGHVYQLSSQFLDDNGQQMYRLRRAPHIYNARKRTFLDRIEFDGNKGIGLQVSQGSNYWRAQSTLQVSYDGGKTYPNQWQLDWGKDGEVKARPYKTHMGSGYDIVLQLECTDPVDWMISACDLETQLGLS